MEIKLIPTHKYRTTVVFFDDDKTFLEFVESHINLDKYNFRFVTNYDEFIEIFNTSESIKKTIPSILVKIDDELRDSEQHEAFDFDFSKFAEIHALPNKDQEISLAFIDNDLGNLNGIQICTELKTDTKKILLTGTSDFKGALMAMSEKHIANYVPKVEAPDNLSNNEDLVVRLNRIIEHFTDEYFREKDYYKNKLLVDGEFKRLLKHIVDKYNITEYSMFGKDSLLLIDNFKNKKILKCWIKSDFEQYYIDHYDDLDQDKNNLLTEVKELFRFPINSLLVESMRYEHLYYCIY